MVHHNRNFGGVRNHLLAHGSIIIATWLQTLEEANPPDTFPLPDMIETLIQRRFFRLVLEVFTLLEVDPLDPVEIFVVKVSRFLFRLRVAIVRTTVEVSKLSLPRRRLAPDRGGVRSEGTTISACFRMGVTTSEAVVVATLMGFGDAGGVLQAVFSVAEESVLGVGDGGDSLAMSLAMLLVPWRGGRGGR